MANPAPLPRAGDPLPAFCFRLDVVGLGACGLFRSIGGLKSETEVVAYREGGANGTTRQLIGGTRWPNLVLKRGFCGPTSDLAAWRDEVVHHDRGRSLQRRSGSVVQLRHDLSEVCRWTFVDGWPCRWDGPDFDAMRSELSIETLEIAHEGLWFRSADRDGR